MEMFSSIQGEGFNTGKAASFLRFAGCNVGCVWCDVKDSWDAKEHKSLSSNEIISELSEFETKNLVITGGEPMMYDLSALSDQLRNRGFKLWLETSGAYKVSGKYEWLVVSPKKFKPALDEVLEVADELKIVIYHKADLEWALQYKEKVKPNCKLYLQPEWSKRDKMGLLISDFIKKNPEWRISLQTHKYLHLP